VAHTGVVLTSQADDSSGGQVLAQPGQAQAGAWRGVRVEKSAAALGGVSFADLLIRYAGGQDQAGLTLRGISPALQYLQVSDSTVGLRLLDGAKPVISGSSFLRNAIGIELAGLTDLTIGSAQFAAYTQWAILNKSQAQVVSAKGNWWGDASGPLDAADNPAGLGDPVSAGVNYANALNLAPLLAPSLRVSHPATFHEQRQIELLLSCINATEYRVAENAGFAGVPFSPLVNGRGTLLYTVSEGDGRKPISVQYRNSTGTVVTAALSNGVLIDTLAPTVAVNSPAAGSVVTGPITIEASVSDAGGVAQVQFLLDGVLLGTRAAAPYSQSWNNASAPEGEHTLRVVATDVAGRTTAVERTVTLTRAVVLPDTEGPALTAISHAGVALLDGAQFSRTTVLSLQASDRSGVARIEWLLDGALLATASGSGAYTASLDFSQINNGAHVLSVRATDSLGNLSRQDFQVQVANAAPDAPRISSPAAGLSTRNAELVVSGIALPGSSVQVLVNGAASGAAVAAGADGDRKSTRLN